MLVREFLQDSALKVLPQNQFEDAIMAYVDKGDKGTMDSFINESLSKSLKYLANLDDTTVLGDLDGSIERCKEVLQERWSKSEGKWIQKTRLLPQPADYDSDKEGPWDDPDKPGRWVEIPQPKSQARRGTGDGDVDMDDDEAMFVANISDSDPFAEVPVQKPAVKRGAASAATRGGRGGAAKKAAPAAKPATRGRPKKGGFIVDSEDEEDEEEEAQDDAMSLDDFNDDDEEVAVPPKRGSRATKAAPAKATKATTSRASMSRAAAKPAASKGRQSTLNFSQSQRPTSSRVNQTQKTLTISDDEIDDDDDDGFEPVAPTRSSRR